MGPFESAVESRLQESKKEYRGFRYEAYTATNVGYGGKLVHRNVGSNTSPRMQLQSPTRKISGFLLDDHESGDGVYQRHFDTLRDLKGWVDRWRNDYPTPQPFSEGQDSRIEDYLPGFFQRHPVLSKYRSVKMLDADAGAGFHPEANTTPRSIHFYKKFWQHDQTHRDWIVAHELGHWALQETIGKSGLMNLVDIWGDLPFGQDSSEESFAESFASYFLDGEVKRKYPDWAKAVETVHQKYHG